MSRRSRTTLTFELSFPLPAKVSQKHAEEFLLRALADAVETRHKVSSTDPLGFLELNELTLRTRKRDVQYF